LTLDSTVWGVITSADPEVSGMAVVCRLKEGRGVLLRFPLPRTSSDTHLAFTLARQVSAD